MDLYRQSSEITGEDREFLNGVRFSRLAISLDDGQVVTVNGEGIAGVAG